MSAAEVFAALAAALGVGIATVFIGTAVPERSGVAILVATSLTVAAAATLLGLQVSTGWIAAALAFASALALSWGRLERLLVWVVGPALTLALHSAWSLLLPVLEPMTAASVLALWIAGSAIAGLSLRRLRLCAWFAELSALSLLAGLALMAGPVLAMSWRRAAIAAEGQDPASAAEPILLWPLALAAAAFAAGIGWRFIVRNPSDRNPG